MAVEAKDYFIYFNIYNENSMENCFYFSANDFRNRFRNIENEFIVFHQNIRSFSRNGEEFLLYLNSLDVSVGVIVLSETWFTNETTQEIEGYNSFHITRNNRIGGGVSVYVRNDFNSKFLPLSSSCRDLFEVCSVHVKISNNFQLNVADIYRPPSASTYDFTNEIESFLETNWGPSVNALLCSDLNLDLSDHLSNHVSGFMQSMQSQSFLPHITIPTRVTNSSATIIDHM